MCCHVMPSCVDRVIMIILTLYSLQGPRQTLLLGIGRVPTLNSLDRPVSKGSSDGGVGSPPIIHDQGPPSNTLGPAPASQ